MGDLALAPVTNAYLVNDASIALISRDGSGRRVFRQVPAEWIAYFAASDLSERLQRDLRSSSFVKSIKREGTWIRVGFVNRTARESFCVGSQSFVAHLGIPVYEAD